MGRVFNRKLHIRRVCHLNGITGNADMYNQRCIRSVNNEIPMQNKPSAMGPIRMLET